MKMIILVILVIKEKKNGRTARAEKHEEEKQVESLRLVKQVVLLHGRYVNNMCLELH